MHTYMCVYIYAYVCTHTHTHTHTHTQPLCQEWVEQNMAGTGEKVDMDIMSQRAGIWEQISIIGVRNVRNVSRNPMGARAKIMQANILKSPLYSDFV